MIDISSSRSCPASEITTSGVPPERGPSLAERERLLRLIETSCSRILRLFASATASLGREKLLKRSGEEDTREGSR
eukprot:scaffold280950_cov30-Tisochrysis_lutea.AAC.1